MRCIITRIGVLTVLCLAFSWGGFPQLAWAGGHGHGHGADEHGKEEAEGHGHDKAERHGGQATMTNEFHFEVLFHRDSVQVYFYDGKQNPISARGASGTVSLSFRDHHRERVSAELAYVKPAEKDEGGHGHGHKEKTAPHPQDFLEAAIDLAKVQEGAMKALFDLKGLAGKEEKAVSFKETFKLARLIEYACPMKDTKPSDSPGTCKKCGMELGRVTYIYGCTMHPKVTSRNSADTCWVCGMKLIKPADDHEEKLEEKHEEHGEKEHGH